MNILTNKWFKLVWVEGQFWSVFGSILGLFLASILGYLTPIWIKNLFGSLSGGEEFYFTAGILLLLFVGEYINRAFYQLSINYYVRELLQQVRFYCYQNWLDSHEERNTKNKASFPLGEVLARLMNDTEAVRELISSGSFAIIIDFFFIVSCLISLLKLNSTTGVFLFFIELVVVSLLVYGSKYMANVFYKVRKSNGVMSRTVANVSGGLEQTYFINDEQHASKTAHSTFMVFLKQQLKANVWDASYYSFAESLFPIFLAFIVLILPYSQVTEIAIIGALIDIVQRSIGPIKDVAGKISNIQRASAGLKRIEEFNEVLLPSIPVVDNVQGWKKLKEFEVEIPFFEYQQSQKNDSHPFALHQIQFSASAGDLIGIVGASGSGKSTLFKLLTLALGKENLNFTAREVDGVEHRLNKIESPWEEYRRSVALVSQDSHVFSLSLKDNITLGHDDAQFESFWKFACDQVAYLKHWEFSPDDILPVERLSMGQKQLVCSLRASYLKRPIVLLDEVSSGLDSELEEALRQLILLIQKEAITMSITHRVETVLMATRLLVMHDGRIVAQGSHDELIQSSREYGHILEEMKSLARRPEVAQQL